MKIGCDVDLVVVGSDEYWLEWLQKVTDKSLPEPPTEYDLTKHFEEELKYNGVDGFHWWRQEGIYDSMAPYPSAIEVLNKWKDFGDEIIFISTVKGNHHKSKYNMLSKYFDFDGFLATKEKHHVDVDVMIDDKLEVIDDFLAHRPTTIPILFPTRYNQGGAKVLDPNVQWELLHEERLNDFDMY